MNYRVSFESGDLNDDERVSDISRRLVQYASAKHGAGTHEAEDAAQESWLGYLVKSAAVKDNVFGYLVRSVRNKIIDWRRKRNRRNTFCESQLDDKQKESLFDNVAEAEVKEPDYSALHRSIGELPEMQRQVIELFYFGGNSYAEISDLLQIPKATVAGRLLHAKESLREKVKRYEDK